MRIRTSDSDNRINIKSKLTQFYKTFGIVLVLLFMIIVLSIATPYFLAATNLINVVRQISFIAIIGFGVTLVIITGGIDLSSGSIVGVTSIVSTMLAHPGEHSLIVSLLAGIGVGVGAGLINGLFIAKTGTPPFIATLGMMTSGRGVALLISGGRPVNNVSDEYIFLGAGRVLGIPVPIIILLVLVVIMYIVLNKTPFGRHVLAVGGNEEAAKISGINTGSVKILVYVIAGALASVAGIMMSARVASGQPALGTGYEMDAVASAVIGGTSLMGGVGTIWGTLCGALIIGLINNGMDLMGVNAYWQQITKGIIIILAVILDQLRNKRE